MGSITMMSMTRAFFAKASLRANKILSRSMDRFRWTDDFEERIKSFEVWLKNCRC